MKTRVLAIALMLGCCMAPALYAAEPAPPTLRQAALSWGAVTQDVEGNTITGVTYNVYRGVKGSPLASKTRIATGLTALSLVDAGRPAGVEECYQITAFKGTEGGPSNEGCKSYPAVAPGSTTLTVQ